MVFSNVVQRGPIDVQGKKNENVSMNVRNAGNYTQNLGYADKEKRKNEKRVTELTQKQETMIQKGECSSPRDDTNDKKEKKAKENCLIQFVILHILLKDISKEDFTNTCFSSGFQRAFLSLFREEIEYFAPRLFFNMDKLEKKLNEQEFNEEITMVVFKMFKNQVQQFITTHITMDYDDQMANKFFTEYTLCDAQVFQNILIDKMDSFEKAIVERGLYKRACDIRENERMMQTSGTQLKKQNESSRSRNDTRADGADIKLSNEPELMNEVQSTAAYNVFANDRQHPEQPKFINEGGVDQDVEQRLDKRHLLLFVIENKTTESLNQTLEVENDCLKKNIAKLQKDFSKLEAQSIAFEIALQHKTSTLSEFMIDHILGKDDSSPSSIAKSNIFEHEKESGENVCENATCELQTKIVELEKILTQQTKDFDDVNLELSNRTTKFKAYGYIRNQKKTIKNGQARTRESEEYKKKPKIQSRSQKSQPSVKVVKSWSTKVNKTTK
ncbi:hypothetical protein Tco_0215609 [Tanacetum coccineum]